MNPKKQKFNVIIVLAGGIHPSGKLKKASKLRVEKGVELFNKGLADYMLMSGSYSFTLKNAPQTTEAKEMLKYATKLGVPKNKILLEDKSQDTVGNAYFSKIILNKKKWYELIVVTQEFHIKRSKYIFKKVYGPKYKIKFFKARNDESGTKLKDRLTDEAKILNLTKKIFNKIKNGDDKKIYKMLQELIKDYQQNIRPAKKSSVPSQQIIKKLNLKSYGK